jgi:[ribosomal protein S5]-alanine N-acetyltransferase
LTITETARLRLRLLTLADAPFIYELHNDPDFLRNIGERGVHSVEDAERYLASRLMASYARYGFGLYMVELKERPAAVGMCGLLRRDSHEDVELGFATLAACRGQGYTLEAARGTLQFGLNTLGLTRIVAIAAPSNVPSIRILETLGLRYERRVNFSPEGSESSLYVLDTKPAA